MNDSAVIGEIEGCFPQKFIISECDSGLRFDARSFVKTSADSAENEHRFIAESRKIDESKVLGGGYVELKDDGLLRLSKFSEKFGGVPHKVLENFLPELLEYYQSHYEEVEALNYDWVWDLTASGKESIPASMYEQTIKWDNYLE